MSTYLSVYTDSRGQRAWVAIVDNIPVCAPSPDRECAAAALRRFLRGAPMPSMMWDGDLGAFVAA